MNNPASQKGFTLAELMIALLVFAFVASIGVYTLRLGAEAREQLEETEKNVRDLELMRVVLKNDLLQMTPRPVRDEFGERVDQWFFGGDAHPISRTNSEETLLISFVRGGWINPEAKEPRSSLQYVEYIAREKQLVRRVRPFLDAARNQPTAERILLDDLSEIGMEFLRGELRGRLDWDDAWPASGSTAPVPQAIALTIANQRYGQLRFLFLINEVSA